MPNSLKAVLLFTRLAIFYFLLPWQLIRFAKPEAINNISNKYYKFAASEMFSMISGVLMMLLLIAFVTGFKKRISYGLVLILHTIGTIMTTPYLIVGSDNINMLFLAAIPTIAAMALLYILREEDTILSFKGKLG
jgi:uncharacterized membrane protein